MLPTIAFAKCLIVTSHFYLSSIPRAHCYVSDCWKRETEKQSCEKCCAVKIDVLTDDVQLFKIAQKLFSLRRGGVPEIEARFDDFGFASTENCVTSSCAGTSLTSPSFEKFTGSIFSTGLRIYSVGGSVRSDLVRLNSATDKEFLHQKSFCGGSPAVLKAKSAHMPWSSSEMVARASARETRIISGLRSDVLPLCIPIIVLGSFR